MPQRNLLEDLPDARRQEVTEVLVQHPHCRLERIVSQGQASPPGYWYDQREAEWVMVLAGNAVLAFDDGQEVALGPGDSLLIPAHQKHRVASTSDQQPTIWLALFFSDMAPIAAGD